MNKPLWHRPRITVVDVAIGTIFAVRTIAVGKKSKKLLFTSAPHVTIAPSPERKARERKQNAKDQEAFRQRRAKAKAEAKAEAKEYNSKHKNRHKKPEQVFAVTAWLTKSESDQPLLQDVDLEPIGRQLTRSEWREVKSRAATARIRKTFKNNW